MYDDDDALSDLNLWYADIGVKQKAKGAVAKPTIKPAKRSVSPPSKPKPTQRSVSPPSKTKPAQRSISPPSKTKPTQRSISPPSKTKPLTIPESKTDSVSKSASAAASSIARGASSAASSIARGASAAASSIANGVSNMKNKYNDSKCKSAVQALNTNFENPDYSKRLDKAVHACYNVPNKCDYVRDTYEHVHDLQGTKKGGLFKKDRKENVGDWFRGTRFMSECQLK